MKNRYCEGACLPEGLMLRPKLSSDKKKLTEPYCGMKEKSKAKSLSKWKLIPERKTGAIYTRLLAVLGVLKMQNCRRLRAYLNQLRETLKFTNFPAKTLLRSKKSSKIYVIFVDKLGLQRTT